MNKKGDSFLLMVLVLLISLPSYSAQANNEFFVGAFGVGHHSSCKQDDLPDAVKDAQGFLQAMPKWMSSNRLLKNTQVRKELWIKSSDAQPSDSYPSGLKGVDGNFMSYITSHGVTEKGIFILSMGSKEGSKEQNGCDVTSKEMHLGDESLRYLFFSTCQSVKIGQTDHPHRKGESPQITWNPRVVNGVRCIYGYSSDSVDDPDYGKKFWKKWKRKGVTIVDAFFQASREIDSQQIPAVVCFGQNLQEAQDLLQEEEFQDAPSTNKVAAWRWQDTHGDLYDSHRKNFSPSSLNGTGPILKTVRWTLQNFHDVQQLSKTISGLAWGREKGEQEHLLDQGRPQIWVDQQEMIIQFRPEHPSLLTTLTTLTKPKALINKAKNFLIEKGFLQLTTLQQMDEEFFTQHVFTTWEGNSLVKNSHLLQTKIIFKQKVGPAYFLGEQGEIRVTLNQEGEVILVESNLKKLEKNDFLGPLVNFISENELALAYQQFQHWIKKIQRLNWPLGHLVQIQTVELGYIAKVNPDRSGEGTLGFSARVAVTHKGFTKIFKLQRPL